MMHNLYRLRAIFLAIFVLFLVNSCSSDKEQARITQLFNDDWKFSLVVSGDDSTQMDASVHGFDDSQWRELDLPHDWSIEGEFSRDNPATPGGGALPGGTGWYRKSFSIPDEMSGKLVFIEFDGVYQNSEVWINGHYLGIRPNGYISFRYELSPYLYYGDSLNMLAVKVDNSVQPNSRWYSGSGIYRDVRLVYTGAVYVDHWGTCVTTPEVTGQGSKIRVNTSLRNSLQEGANVTLHSTILNSKGKKVASTESQQIIGAGNASEIIHELEVLNPELWSVDEPVMYKLVTTVTADGETTDTYTTPFGIRYFEFTPEQGFFLNGEAVKLKGVCNHHDLGCLGAAAYPRAIERQLELLREMGCNAIRTSHNPPSPILLDLCDRMGFIVMDESFDMWERAKTRYDYHLYWAEWHKRDLSDHILRDRNHPSVIMWSIGNEIPEQWDSTGIEKAIHLAGIVKELDDTRPITSGCNEPGTFNFIFRSGTMDIIGFNYHLEDVQDVPQNYPGKPFILAESTSALATRGYYDMPSEDIRIWPVRWDRPAPDMNAGQTCSAYDNCHVPWGSTHEAALKALNENDFVSGIFVWTGFDYLGEPTPYRWPSRSSYFGIIDLAGFPKDAFYLYKSQWTDEPVLHIFPHWNWEEGDTIDVWAYTNCSEVELFLDNTSLGSKTKPEGSLHMQWKVPYSPGTLKAIGTFNQEGAAEGASEGTPGEVTMETFVETLGAPARVILSADRTTIDADNRDLSFVTVGIVDENNRVVPDADNFVSFEIEGEGSVIGVDNGLQTSMESFVASSRKAFNGLCLAVIKSTHESGKIILRARSEGLEGAAVEITSR